MRNLGFDLVAEWPQVDSRCAASEGVLNLCEREAVVDDLLHRELVQVGIEKGLNDRWHGDFRLGAGPLTSSHNQSFTSARTQPARSWRAVSFTTVPGLPRTTHSALARSEVGSADHP